MNYIFFKGGFRENNYFDDHLITDTDEVFVLLEPWSCFKKRIENVICHVFLSPKLNSKFRMPFKTHWITKIIRKHKFERQDDLCLIFNAHFCGVLSKRLVEKIKKRFHGTRIVIYFSDKIDFYEKNYKNYPSIGEIKKLFDLAYSYNVGDCEKYNLVESRLLLQDFSKVPLDKSIPESDIFFIGQDKGRLSRILDVYDIATRNGLKCDFYITKVPKDHQEFANSINYDVTMPYSDVLKRVKRTKCVLNIIQENGDGITMRDYEAFGMDKLVLTNSDAITKCDFYSQEQVIGLSELESRINDIKIGYKKHNNYISEFDYNHFYKWLSNILKG